MHLLSKVRGYRMGGEFEDRVSSFVPDRKHKVCICGISSNAADVMNGILKGSVLAPVLFVLYINDLHEIVNSDV